LGKDKGKRIDDGGNKEGVFEEIGETCGDVERTLDAKDKSAYLLRVY
jgi:hypothetical protein